MSVATLPAKVQKGLVNLYGKAQKNDDERAKFSAAVRIAQKKGWPYRTLGTAIGISYEMVRIYATKDQDAPITEKDLGFEIPARGKALKVLPIKEVPAEVTESLTQLFNAAVSDQIQSRQDTSVSPEVAAFFAALASAEAAGWDAHSVGRAIGVHPRAVSRFIQHHHKFGESTPGPKYPKAPEENLVTAWDAKYPSTPPVKIPSDVAEKMKSLQAEARDNRGNEAAAGTNPALEAARQYTMLLGEWYLRGAARAELEAATGQNWEALRMRLSRWGFMTKPSWTPPEPRRTTRRKPASKS